MQAYRQNPGAYRCTLPSSAIASVAGTEGRADELTLWLVVTDATGAVHVSPPPKAPAGAAGVRIRRKPPTM
jgi:hypothetical protein